jgi:hypothetical protein
VETKVRKRAPDWKKIKKEYAERRKSLRQLGAEHGVSHTAIAKRAKAEKWARRSFQVETSPVAVAAPAITVAAAASAEPNDLVKGGREVLELLLAELKAEAVHVGWLDDVIAEETKGDRSPRRRMAMERAVSLPTRMQAAKNYATAVRTLHEAAPGKKEQAKEEARKIGQGRFATPPAPAKTDWGDDLVDSNVLREAQRYGTKQ